MAEIDDIQDTDSFRAWLTETNQSRHALAALAVRVALRVFPGIWHRMTRNQIPLIPYLRSNLIDSVIGTAPTPVLTEVSNSGEVLDKVADPANRIDATWSVGGQPDLEAIYWAALRSDCRALASGAQLGNLPLFDTVPTKHLDFANYLRAGINWWFWGEWYYRVLNGEPQNWRLLLKIATQPGEFWQGSDSDINARIAEIVAKYEDEDNGQEVDAEGLQSAVGNTPNAEFIVVNETPAFDVEPQIDIEDNFYEDALVRVRDAIDDARAIPPGYNLHGAFDKEVALLERDLQRRSGKPLRIYECLMQVLASVDRRCLEQYLPTGEIEVEGFRAKIDASARDIRLNDRFVREQVSKRALERLNQFSAEQQGATAEAAQLLAEVSAPILADELREDAETVLDQSEQDLRRADALYRLSSRILRMYGHIRARTRGIDKAMTVNTIVTVGGIVVGLIAIFA